MSVESDTFVARPRLVAIGEVLWDVFPDDLQLGGAALNFALHAGALGAQAQVLSRIGMDALGDRILAELKGRSVDLNLLQRDAGVKTGVATVELSESGEPGFRLAENAGWDFIEANDLAMKSVKEADVVYFGSLAQRSEVSRSSIQKLVSAARPDSLRIFDANLRAPFIDREIIQASLDLANIVKVNDAELPLLAAMFSLPYGTLESHARDLAVRFDLKMIACTLGGNGSFLVANDRIERHPGRSVEVVNTVGAGDSFAAALVMGLLAGRSLAEISANANAIAAFVCGQPGATPVLPQSLCLPFRSIVSPLHESTAA